MTNLKLFFIALILLIPLSCSKEEKVKEQLTPEPVTIKKILTDEELRSKADSLAKKLIIVDTHIDVPYRLNNKWEDISRRTARGDFDYPRSVKGGLNGAFMSIYTSPRLENTGGSKALADKLINMVNKVAEENPDKFAIAYSVSDVIKQFNSSNGTIVSLPMGMENGSPIEAKIENVKYFYDRGIRYITLAHTKNNHICDSSNEKEPLWNGLSLFGKKVVEEMNRLGIIIDVSHISDSAFYQVLKYSKAPVIASHSSCRHFTPRWKRNMSDEMIKMLAEKGGVIQINFGSAFLRDDLRKKSEYAWDEINKHIEENNLSGDTASNYFDTYMKKHNPGYADIKDVVAHIDHVVKIAGIDHVGLGSDFDGVGDSLPIGLKDVSQYPNLIYELLKAGYSDEDIEKICSANTLRVWSEVERISNSHE